MEIGAVFPQTEIGTDVGTVRDYARTVEALGYGHMQAYDHVLGADPDRPGWTGTYDNSHQFHEPLTLFSFVADVTESVTLLTGILILPQRQTGLVAKQAAQVDVLSGGRLRLGVAVGWNPLEYEALGEDFGTRGDRIEEQVDVLRRLWTDETVTFEGAFHSIPGVGINPRPVQRPIPVWMGGDSDTVLRRTARIADGWCAQDEPPSVARPKLEALREYLEAEGRESESFPVQIRMPIPPHEADGWAETVAEWEAMGVSHLTVDTMEHGLDDPADHAVLLEEFAGRIDLDG